MNYDIELNANDSSVLETQYAFTQGDYGQIQFSIRVKANGVYVTNAQRAYIVFTLPNGYVVTGADMTKSVATYTYPFQGSELQVPGIIIAEVKLVYTDGQISSNKFSFICRYDPLHDKSFNAGPYISQLQTFIDEAQLKIDYLQTLIETLQPDVGGTTLTRSDLHNTRDAVTAGLKVIDANMAQNILLKSDVTHQNENDANKIVAADSLYSVKTNLQTQIDTTNSNLTNKMDSSRIRTVFGIFNNTSASQAFTISGIRTVPSYLLAAQIQLSEGVWTDMAALQGITRIDNNTTQVNVIRDSATTYTGYQVRFVFLD